MRLEVSENANPSRVITCVQLPTLSALPGCSFGNIHIPDGEVGRM